MLKKSFIRNTALLLLLGIVAYNSVFFKKLDEVKVAGATSAFDAKAYAENYWNKKLLPALDKAVEINQLVSLLHADKEKAFSEHSHALGIGNIRYLLVKGSGVVTAVKENEVVVVAKNDTASTPVHIATEYIFGNAVRDAPGIINISEFTNTMDFNNVSAAINQKIKTEVVPPFTKQVKQGMQVQFTGAIELNKEHVNLADIELIPIRLELAPDTTKP